MYCEHHSSCEDISANNFPVRQVHKIGILDIRLANTDRNEANILVTKKLDKIELIPIDHGLVLPRTLSDVWFDWLYWPQAEQHFDEETKSYIARLDPDADCAILRGLTNSNTPYFDDQVLRNLKVCTLFLKKGAAADLTLFDLGEMMSRKNRLQPSFLERAMMEAEEISGRNEQQFFDCLNVQLDQLISDRT